MRLNAPKKRTFLIAIIIAAIGLIMKFIPVAILTTLSFWVLLAAFVLLALSTFMKGL